MQFCSERDILLQFLDILLQFSNSVQECLDSCTEFDVEEEEEEVAEEEDMMVVDDERDHVADGDLNPRPLKLKSEMQTIRLRCLKQN